MAKDGQVAVLYLSEHFMIIVSETSRTYATSGLRPSMIPSSIPSMLSLAATADRKKVQSGH